MLKFENFVEAKVLNITPLAMKKGAKEILPALSFRFEGMMSNVELDQFFPGLRQLLFTKASTSPDARAKQKDLEGVAPVSDLPSLSEAGQKLGVLQWAGEQTGCGLAIDYGLGGDSNTQLEGGTQKKVAFQGLEGGGCRWWFTYNSSAADELDDETVGRLAKLKMRKIKLRIVPPKVEQPQLPAGATLTPIGSLEAAVEAGIAAGEAGDAKPQGEAAWPFPKEQAAKKPRASAPAH